MAKSEKENKVSLGLAGPSIWSAANTPEPPDQDGRVVPVESEGLADINPAAISDAQDFARDMITDGRRHDGNGNTFHPSSNKQIVASVDGQLQISPTVKDETNNVFAASEDMVFTDADAQYQMANSSPGVTPNFFKSSVDDEKIGDIIDKTGNTAGKTAKDVIAAADSTVNVAVQNQLSAENDFEPDETYESKNQSSTDPADALSDVLYNRSLLTKGISENNNAAGTLGNILGNVQAGTLNHSPVSTNDYSPPPGFSGGPVDAHKKGDAISTPDNANQFADASDMAFNDANAQYQLANSTPGAGPNFFKSSVDDEKISDLIDKTGADASKDVKALYAKAALSAEGAPGDLTVAVQSQLAANNAYDPNEDSSPYTSKNTSSEADFTTDKLYSGDQDTLGQYSSEGVGVSLDDLNTKASVSGPAGDLLGDPRAATHSNSFTPSAGADHYSPSHKVGDAVATSQAGFAGALDDPAQEGIQAIAPVSLQTAGMGLPSTDSTPGSDALTGQKIGTFFTKDQIDDVLDKTGATPGDGTEANPSKMGSALAEKAETVAGQVDTQLDLGNKYNPGDEYANISLAAEDVGMPIDPAGQTTKGAYSPNAQTVSPAGLAQSGHANLVEENTNFPVAHGIAVEFSEAEDEIIAGEGDNFFKTPTELTFPAGTYSPGGSTPGVGNSFFTPTQVDGTDPADPGFDVIDDANNLLQKVGPDSDGNAGIINTATQTQLADGNVNDPDDPHTTAGGSQIDFPEPGNPFSNTNEPTYPTEQTQKGKFDQTSDVQAHTSFASQQSTAAADLGVNQHHPSLPIISPNAVTLITSDAQSKIIAGADDDFFQPPTIDTDDPADGVTDKLPQAVTYTGLGVPKTEGGDGSPVTKLGTFFTQEQIDAVLNKEASLVGADDKTLPGGELFSSANLVAIESNVEEQLEAGNINTPAAEHTLATNIDFPKPGDAKGSQAREISYPSDQTHMGGYVKPDSDKTFAAHVVDQTNNDTAKYTDNTYHTIAPSNVEGALSPSPSDADSFVTPGTDDKFFATDTQLVDSPGAARPNFFTEQDAERQALDQPLVPQNVPLTSDNFGEDQQKVYEGDVRAKLSAENFFYPAAGEQEKETQTGGATEGLVDTRIDFPDLVAHKKSGGLATKDSGEIPDSSKAIPGEKEAIRSAFDESAMRDKADALLDANVYRPRLQGDAVTKTSVANVIAAATEPIVETADDDGKVTRAGDAWFVPKQDKNRRLDAVSGKSIAEYGQERIDKSNSYKSGLRDSSAHFRTPAGGIGTDLNLVYSSKLVSETGPDDSADVIAVPKPGEKLGAQYDRNKDHDPHEVLDAVLDMLEGENIYHPTNESPFFSDPDFFRAPGDDDTAPNENKQPMFSIQRELGKFIQRKEDADSGSGTQVTLGDMISFSQAFRLLGTGDTANAANVLNGGGISVIANPLVQMGLDGLDFTSTNLRSLADGTNSADLKKKLKSATGNTNFVSPKTANITDRASIGEVGQSNSIGKNAASFGQLNNYYEPFGNGVLLDSIGMLALAALAIISMLVLALVLEVLIGNFADEDFSNDRAPSSPETMAFGRNAGVVMLDGTGGGGGGAGAGQAGLDFLLEDLMRIPRTDYALHEAIAHGMTLMLGFPSGLTSTDVGFGLATGQGLVDFAINLLTAPGYYLNYVRQITMSGQLVSAEFAGIGGAAQQGPEKLFTSLDKLFNSKFIRFIFISAQVGDQNLKSLFGNTSNKAERLYQLKNKGGVSESSTDPLQLLIDGKQSLSQMNAKGAQISIDQGMAQNLSLIPRLRGNLTRWGNSAHKNPLSLSTFIATSVSDIRAKNLFGKSTPMRYLKADRATVEHVERAIDAEYMPFYFHDLRTHEIISIPAFVTSFDESYAVNYNSYNTYGRQDPVRIYTGAERTINLTFKVVAFNKSDFTSLWYTVNKFVSMVYPQYSKGVSRTLVAGGNDIKFTQPFSQTPAASPLIRIRLGDLYRSNYSTTGLKRLFGLRGDENDDFSVNTNKKSQEAYEAKIEEKVNELAATAADKVAGKGEKPRDYSLLTNKHVFLSVNAKDGADFNIKALFATPVPGEPVIESKNKEVKITTTDGKVEFTAGKYYLVPKGTVEGFGREGSSDAPNVRGKFDIVSIESGAIVTLIPGQKLEINYASRHLKGRGQSAQETAESSMQILRVLKSPLIKEATDSAEVVALKPIEDEVKVTKAFFEASNNAVRRSFESTRGTGLAGVITSLSLAYGDATWSTGDEGKAPKEVDISMTFAPMHDLPLGLDHNGQLRGLSHPVAIDHGSSDRPGTFSNVYDELPTRDKNSPGTYPQALDVFDKANRGIDDDSPGAFGSRPPKTDP